jgi:type IV pilus biogenesis protein CpaD/CtpE
MKNPLKLTVCVAITATLGGCASTPSDPDLARTFVPVQTHQTADLGLSCGDLQAQIADNEASVAALDRQIKHDQNQGQFMAMMGAFSGMSGALANNVTSARLANANVALSDAGVSMSGQQALTKEQLRANLEARHETLIGLFYAHSCTPS